MKSKNSFSKDDYLESLSKSGYLLESEIVKELYDNGFIVDPNQTILDTNTGKAREIDIITEYYSYHPEREKVCVKTIFVMEVVNNLFPFVLTTYRTFSPNSMIDQYLQCIVTPNDDNDDYHFLVDVDLYKKKNIYERYVFSQYCSFTTKNKDNQLMAFHPDDTHQSFIKMCDYINLAIKNWNSRKSSNEYWRVFFYKPVLVLKDDLMILQKNDNGDYSLESVDRGAFEFNYYYDEKPTTLLFEIVTRKGLWDLLKEETSWDNELEEEIWTLKKNKA